MKKMQRIGVGLTVAVLTAGTFALVTGTEAALRRSETTKRVVINCDHGWRAGAGGVYGNVPFNVTCANGHGNVRLEGTVGTAYSIRMGVENAQIGADCAWSGDSETVDETCVVVRLTIR